MPNFIKICLLGAQFIHADGQTYMTKLILAFHNFANVNWQEYSLDYIICLGVCYQACGLK